jgi:hypothetical protein
MTTEINGGFVMNANPHFVWRFHKRIFSAIYLDGYQRLFIWMVIAATQWRLVIVPLGLVVGAPTCIGSGSIV